jgi:hypothetical protein
VFLTQIAKSFVIKPDLTDSITEASRHSANIFKEALLSSFAQWRSPLVQAKIEAIGLVDVSFPYSCILKCLVTVP